MQDLGGFRFLPRSNRRIPKRIRDILKVTAFFLVIYWWRSAGPSNSTLNTRSALVGGDVFHETSALGYANYRIPEGTNCGNLQIRSSLAGTQSIHIESDLLDVALSVNHVMVDYSRLPQDQSFIEVVNKTWGEMSGSTVWLEQYQVYLTASRVFFYDRGVKQWAIISFLRLQLHDANWTPVVATITWQGRQIDFPQTVALNIPHEIGGCWYGPEDPRIALEPGVEDAEPAIVFNMRYDGKVGNRAMYAYYPFSNSTVKFHIEDMPPPPPDKIWVADYEKNWAPFFPPQPSTSKGKHPNRYIHFVYDLLPTRIIRCHQRTGSCKFIFEQPHSYTYKAEHNYGNTGGEIRGGTNFELLPKSLQIRPGLTTYIGLTRTHTYDACGEVDFYRSQITLLTTDGTSYYLDYVSGGLTNLDHLFLTEAELQDPCGKGRIVLANSIARVYDDEDTIDVTWSVNDASVQVGKLRGIQGLVGGLPQWQTKPNIFGSSSWPQVEMQSVINVTRDLLGCSERSSTEYALLFTPPEAIEEHRKALNGGE